MSPPETSHAGRLEVELTVEDGLDARWDEQRIQALVTGIVEREVAPGAYVIALHLVGDETIRQLNREHRGKDAATDVLSFPLQDASGADFVMPPGAPVHLGDVLVSSPRAVAQALEFGHSRERELAYLAAHGVLHLLGYDHEEEADRARMRAREEEALSPFGLTR